MTDPESPMVSEYRRWVSELEANLRVEVMTLRATHSGEDAAAVLWLRESLAQMRKTLAEAERCAEVGRGRVTVSVCQTCGHERLWALTPAGNESVCEAPMGEDDPDDRCGCLVFVGSGE